MDIFALHILLIVSLSVFTFTFMHLADAFIQSDLHCIQVTVSTFYQLLLSTDSVPSVRALRVYIEHSTPYRKSEQLFVGFGNHAKCSPVTKQRISMWLVEAITLAYSSLGLQCLIRVRAHSIRGIASSWAWSSGVSISEICEAASLSSSSTFVRFYNLDVPALQARVISPELRAVIQSIKNDGCIHSSVWRLTAVAYRCN